MEENLEQEKAESVSPREPPQGLFQNVHQVSYQQYNPAQDLPSDEPYLEDSFEQDHSQDLLKIEEEIKENPLDLNHTLIRKE